MKDNFYMKEAIKEAKKASSIYDEVPIGAILVYKDKIIGRGHNMVETKKNPLAHAEIMAINEAVEYLGGWRLEGATLYVTLEPCAMCAGAIVNARIDTIVMGARDEKRGCVGSQLNLLATDFLNHRVEIRRDVLKGECSELLTNFFKELRENRGGSYDESGNNNIK